jgi:hypothetical protein
MCMSWSYRAALIPEEWNLSIECTIHKKGDNMIRSNYRGVNLLCTMYKVFSNVLFNRLAPYVQREFGDYQMWVPSEKVNSRTDFLCMPNTLKV